MVDVMFWVVVTVSAGGFKVNVDTLVTVEEAVEVEVNVTT